MGKRRLATALELYRERAPDAKEPAVRWLPFQLNPDLPESGIPRAEYLQRKFGSPNHSYARVAAVNAHRLLHYADQQGRQDEVSEVLFRAYFIEGANITDIDTLADVGERAGLQRNALADYLASDADRELVQAADIEARGGGINGVPYFIFNRKVGVSGAQEAEVLLQAMLQAAG
ncbi:MAG: DsbA family oxidoreductase [Betaproteobacteria bacterium]|nr:DsbA family oxidoreductase [Betaproteobacteria bacterium]